MPIKTNKSKRIKRFAKFFNKLSKTEKASIAGAIGTGFIAGGPAGAAAAVGVLAAGERLIRGTPTKRKKRKKRK